MKTIALRFADGFAPECGTIEAHQQIIDKYGYVWYGKLGAKISKGVAECILNSKERKILLIHSGSTGRYWAYVDSIKYVIPERETIPEYYRNQAENFNTWFRVVRIEEAPKDIMAHSFVASSGMPLNRASKHSMSPYFIIITGEEGSNKDN